MWLFLLPACAPEKPPAATAPAPVAETEAPAPPPPAPAPSPNRAPRVEKVVLVPEAPTFTDLVKAEVTTTDADQDPVTLDYTWYINGESQSDVSFDQLRPGRFKRGDLIEVEVRPSDGKVEGEARRAKVVVANAPIVMDTQPRELTRIDGFRMKATDPDGEPITWRLEGQPKGMRIDADGTLRYQGSEDDPGGAYTVRIVAEDAGGAYAVMEVPLQVRAGSKATKG